jgi:hypothetical protein
MERIPDGEAEAIARIIDVERHLLQRKIDQDKLPSPGHPVPRPVLIFNLFELFNLRGQTSLFQTGVLLMRYRTLIFVAALLYFPGLVHASDLTFTENLVANFEFSLIGGTVINPGPTTPFIPFEAIGSLTFVLDPSLNDPSQPTTVPFTNVTGSLAGVSPPPFLPYTISPNLQFLGGNLTNIVRDGSGNVISADVSDLSMRWDMIGTPDNLTLFTKDGLPFNGSTSSIPFSYGTVLAGAADFNVYLDNGGSDPLVVIGRNRTLTAVPEPNSAALAGLAAFTLGAVMAVRRICLG